MYTSALDLGGLGSSVGSTTNTSKADANSDPQAAQDRFLKLLVAQINSQDPLNPMDNAQMTTQMAQINTVSGIQQLNATLKGMSDQYSAMQGLQGLQGTSLIGRQALVEGNQFSFDGEQARGAVALSGAASQVEIDVVGTNGALIDTVNLGALPAGQHAFSWNAAGVDPSRVAGFSIRATQGGQAVAATPLTRTPVSSVSFTGGAMSLQLQDGRTLGYDQVRAFM